jgi:hypothetical protein
MIWLRSVNYNPWTAKVHRSPKAVPILSQTNIIRVLILQVPLKSSYLCHVCYMSHRPHLSFDDTNTRCGRKNSRIWLWGRAVGSVSLDSCVHAILSSHHGLVQWARFCCRGVNSQWWLANNSQQPLGTSPTATPWPDVTVMVTSDQYCAMVGNFSSLNWMIFRWTWSRKCVVSTRWCNSPQISSFSHVPLCRDIASPGLTLCDFFSLGLHQSPGIPTSSPNFGRS